MEEGSSKSNRGRKRYIPRSIKRNKLNILKETVDKRYNLNEVTLRNKNILYKSIFGIFIEQINILKNPRFGTQINFKYYKRAVRIAQPIAIKLGATVRNANTPKPPVPEKVKEQKIEK